MNTNWNLTTLTEHLKLTCSTPSDKTIDRVCSIEHPHPNGIAFAENTKTLRNVEKTSVAAVIAPPETQSSKPLLYSTNPRVTMAAVMHLLYPKPEHQPGIHPTAKVSEQAQVHPQAHIAPYAVVEANSQIDAKAYIGAHSIIQKDCHIGAHTSIGPRCTIGAATRVEKHCTIEPTCVLGSACNIGSDVYIGTGTILRANVQIHNGCRIDNQTVFLERSTAQHHAIIVSRCLIRQNATLYPYSLIAVESTLDHNLSLGPAVQIAGRTWVRESLMDKGDYGGTYHVLPIQQELRRRATLGRIPQQLRRLEQDNAHVDP